MKVNGFGRAALLVAAGVALVGFAPNILSLAYSGSAAPQDVRDSDVRDVDSGRRYLEQEIRRFLPDLDVEASGTFDYQRIPGEQVVKFLSEQGVVDQGWAIPPESATVVSWTSDEVSFQVPRPRAGVDATLDGDTFFVILNPGDGQKLSGVVSAEALATLRETSIEKHSEVLTLGPWS